LVVSQTPAVHRQIGDLLKQLRAGSGERKSVTVDARWLLLNSDELEQLYMKGPDGTNSLSDNGSRVIDRERLAAFTGRPSSIRCTTNCFSGQSVYIVSGTKQNVVSGFIPVVGSITDPAHAAQLASLSGGSKIRLVANEVIQEQSQKGVGYQPLVERPNLGALLEIRPTIAQGSNTAIVDLKSTVTGPTRLTADALAVSPAPPEVDRVPIHSQELATTMRVPLGEPVLVGGLTLNPSEAHLTAQLDRGEGAAEPEQAQLYLVLEVR
jgi:hypothetical protein